MRALRFEDLGRDVLRISRRCIPDVPHCPDGDERRIARLLEAVRAMEELDDVGELLLLLSWRS
jgi:hypothetical protein